MAYPAGYKYTKDHEWLRAENGDCVIGITDFAQDALGDVVFVELPAVGAIFGLTISTAAVAHTELMVFGALIVFFLIVEPHGLARLWSIGKEKMRLWPFPH